MRYKGHFNSHEYLYDSSVKLEVRTRSANCMKRFLRMHLVQNVLNQLCAALDGLTKSKEINNASTKFTPTLEEAKLTAEDPISLVMNLPDNIAKNSALVLKTMYDEDILEETEIVE